MEVPSLHVTPPDAKPVFWAGFQLRTTYLFFDLFFSKEPIIAPATPPATPPPITVGLSYPKSFKTTTTNIATSAETRAIVKIGFFFIFLPFDSPTHMAFRFRPVFTMVAGLHL